MVRTSKWLGSCPGEGTGWHMIAQTLADGLSRGRGVELQLGMSVVEADQRLRELLEAWPSEDPTSLWGKLEERIGEIIDSERCIRCGTCCLHGSPTLYAEDLPKIESGEIPRSSLYTLRQGEVVSSSRLGKTFALEEDLLKIREASDGGCGFLSESSKCGVYEHRPLQCAQLECWVESSGKDLEGTPRLDRRKLYEGNETALALIEEYDLKLPSVALAEILVRARKGEADAAAEGLEKIELDYRLRAGVEAKLGFDQGEQELLLGRSVLEVAHAHGLKVEVDQSEGPRLVVPKKDDQ